MRLLLTIAALCVAPLLATAGEPRGDYLETRTCDVYTGPCFANGQVGLCGRDAILAWSIDNGSYNGVDLAGRKVILVVRAADTLGFGGGVVIHPYPIKSVALVDDSATDAQCEALVAFAKEQAGKVAGSVVRVQSVAIEMSVDHIDMVGKLRAGDIVDVETRKLAKGDCVCTNEQVFYPPLVAIENSEPAYTVRGSFKGRGLGTQWEAPSTRGSFLGTFAGQGEKLAAR